MKGTPGERSPGSSTKSVCELSLRELGAALEELEGIAARTRLLIEETLNEIGTAEHGIGSLALDELMKSLKAHARRYRVQERSLNSLVRQARGMPRTRLGVDFIASHWQAHAVLLRTRGAVTAALVVAGDWTSPSIDHSMRSCAGRHAGRIRIHVDDYKRDRHHDARKFEREWLREYVDDPHGHELAALMTSGGMAAFTTILHHLEVVLPAGRPVLMGATTYHECTQLLRESALGPRIVPIAEEPNEILAAISQLRPCAVFVDSQCPRRRDEKEQPQVDFDALIDALAGRRMVPHLIVDNTVRSVTLQPWARLPRSSPLAARMIVFESLTKFAQFGFDRTPAGMIVSRREVADPLDECREHLGTNVSDVSALQVPRPMRGALEIRLARIGRNGALLACGIAHESRARGWPLRVLVAPAPARVGREKGFPPGFPGLVLEESHNRDDDYGALAATLVDEARCRGVPLVEGTSFGFDTTRIYPLPPQDGCTKPFLRIAPGAEHLLAAVDLRDCLIAGLDRFFASRSGGRG